VGDALIESTDTGLFSVKGAVYFHNATQLRLQGEKLLKRHASGDCEIDLQHVSNAGSAALSVLLCWLRLADQNDINLTFANLPDDLASLAKVSGMDEIFSLPA